MTSPDSGIPCPWVWVVGDPGEQLFFTVNWDTATRGIMSAISFRELACVYEILYLGTDPYPVAIGETLIRYRDFSTNEFQVIDDIIMTPITVGFSTNINFTATATLEVP